MATILGHFSSYLTALDIYSNLYTSEEIKKFTDTMHELEFDEFLRKFIHNLLHKILDIGVYQFIDKEENKKIFNDGKLSNRQKTQMWATKLFLYVYSRGKSISPIGIGIDAKTLPQYVKKFIRFTGKDAARENKQYTGEEIYNMMTDNFTDDAVKFLQKVKYLVTPALTTRDVGGLIVAVVRQVNLTMDYGGKRKQDDDNGTDINDDDNNDNTINDDTSPPLKKQKT